MWSFWGCVGAPWSSAALLIAVVLIILVTQLPGVEGMVFLAHAAGAASQAVPHPRTGPRADARPCARARRWAAARGSTACRASWATGRRAGWCWAAPSCARSTRCTRTTCPPAAPGSPLAAAALDDGADSEGAAINSTAAQDLGAPLNSVLRLRRGRAGRAARRRGPARQLPDGCRPGGAGGGGGGAGAGHSLRREPARPTGAAATGEQRRQRQRQRPACAVVAAAAEQQQRRQRRWRCRSRRRGHGQCGAGLDSKCGKG